MQILKKVSNVNFTAPKSRLVFGQSPYNTRPLSREIKLAELYAWLKETKWEELTEWEVIKKFKSILDD